MAFISFLETPRFPDNISYGSTGGPQFKTNVFEANSGLEQRSVVWERSKATFNVAHGIRDKVDIDGLIAFFYTVRGKATAFRFKDWADFEFTDSVLGTADGVQTAFPIIKTYGAGGPQPYIRRIYKPVEPDGTVTFEVKIDGVVVAPAAYGVDYTTGILTFNPGFTPNAGEVISVTGEYDNPVRFNVDDFNASLEAFQLGTWSGISLTETLIDAD